MQNTMLDESQAGIKTAGKNIRYADNTILMAEKERGTPIQYINVHIYGIQNEGKDDPIYKEAKETQM